MAKQSREDRVIEATAAGVLGGAAAGFLGGGPLNPADLGDKLLLGAALGAGGAFLIMLAITVGARDWRLMAFRMMWWAVPACGAFVALLVGWRELVGWAFGWAVAGWATGWRAAVLGGVVGGVLVGGFTYLATRPRHRSAQPPSVTEAEPFAAADPARDIGSGSS